MLRKMMWFSRFAFSEAAAQSVEGIFPLTQDTRLPQSPTPPPEDTQAHSSAQPRKTKPCTPCSKISPTSAKSSEPLPSSARSLRIQLCAAASRERFSHPSPPRATTR